MPGENTLLYKRAKKQNSDNLSALNTPVTSAAQRAMARLVDNEALLQEALKRFKETPHKSPTIIPPEKKGGVMAILGKWPGHETDEELSEALKSLG